MPKTTHTPEPWYITLDPQTDKPFEYAGSYEIHHGSNAVAEVNGIPDADRIVACVNACAGINPEAVPLMLDMLCRALPYVEEAERDPAYKPGAVAAVTKAIRAAIAKATE